MLPGPVSPDLGGTGAPVPPTTSLVGNSTLEEEGKDIEDSSVCKVKQKQGSGWHGL